MNNMIFATGGDWDSTTLFNNGQEVLASRLLVDIRAGRDEWGNPCAGGVGCGGEAIALVNPQDNPSREVGIFPGRLELTAPGHQIVIENTHPAFEFEFTRVWYNGHDVTEQVVDLYYEINALDNVVKAYITIYRPHWLSADEVATYTIL